MVLNVENETIRLYVCSEALTVTLQENVTRVLVVNSCDEGLEKKEHVEGESAHWW
jgi:hypothetical protein